MLVELDEEHIKCGICTNKFSTDTNNDDENIRKFLPVLSSSPRCDHYFCHGCILREQLRVAEENNGRVPKWLKCMLCKEKTSFCPSEPKYHRLLIDLVGRAQRYAAARVKEEEGNSKATSAILVELDDEHIKCGICTNKFSTDTDNQDENKRKFLPVLSSSPQCDHYFCHGCILREQHRVAEEKNGNVPKWLKCMHCRENTSFCPTEPKYYRLLIDLVSRAQRYVAAKVKGEESTDYAGNDILPSALTAPPLVRVKEEPDNDGLMGDENEDDTSYELDGSLRIPRADCTQEEFFRHLPHLGTRDMLAWALRTETKVRLSKIEQQRQQGVITSPTSSSYSKVLKSDYLIDLYPEDEGKDGTKIDYSPFGRDEYQFSRKAASRLSFLEDMSEGKDFNGLTPIEIEKKDKGEESTDQRRRHDPEYLTDSDDEDAKNPPRSQRKDVIPPTLLHFEMILEAYMGYNLGAGLSSSHYNSPDSSLPRSAVMGGAVVAALTAYRDEKIVNLFECSEIFDKESGSLQGNERVYWVAKMDLIKKLHKHFIYERWSKEPPSLFSKGDVDIFLQASPFTQSVMNALIGYGIGPDVIDLISSFVGRNAGFCERDLEGYVSSVIGQGNLEAGVIERAEDTEFVFTASKQAVSFILCSSHHYEEGVNEDSIKSKSFLWPRVSQFIMLDSRADLVGGLLDFDQSVAACAFDGISVRVAPRAALSLMTEANFVTPFCFEEQRNKRRVVKYAKRGFRPFLVDPHDTSLWQDVACNALIARKPQLRRSTSWHSHVSDEKQEIARIQEEKMAGNPRTFCCHAFGSEEHSSHDDDDDTPEQFSPLGNDPMGVYRYLGWNCPYTIKMFEKSPDDAIDFFQKRFNWSDEDKRKVFEIDPYLRMSCPKCKNEYNLVRVVLPQFPELMKEYSIEEDNLRGMFSYYMHANGYYNYSPSFYAGGVFDSTLVYGDARPSVQILSKLHSQSIFEVGAYVMKHGSPKDYLKRFVYGNDLKKVFKKARTTTLRKPARPPIGLNPERFVERCEACQRYLVGEKYGSTECKHCSVKKQKVE